MKPVEHIFGNCEPEFAAVERVFRKNFADGWEREGAEFAVFVDGRLVVDLQGGWKDAAASVPWTDQTRTIVFSVTKAVASLCIALLVDRGRLRYEQPVAEFWPEFARNGKEAITVEHVMTHRAGLTRPLPNGRPGTKTAYHAITFGWLVDQIVRRVDEQRRSVSQFFREEIGRPHGVDFHLGLDPAEGHTVSRLSAPPRSHVFREMRADPRIAISACLVRLGGACSLRQQVKGVTDWMTIDARRVTLNNPAVHQLENAAALGITKARELAKLFALVLDGKIVSAETLERIRKPQILGEIDAALHAPLVKGHGFMFEKHPLRKDHAGSSATPDMADQR
ncbi:Beta-lactamase domain-containing protein 2 [Aphelenchoides fujianensis]|nr:Beta-lactamase domain-containing protein 2 [Aphelenchoides fujianensis]